MKYSAIRGTRDIFEKTAKFFEYIDSISRRIFETYGYEEIITPIFESTEVFTRSLGDTTDIVSKEMYSFTDKGNRNISLRPEGTASVVRAIIENSLIKSGFEKRFFYTGPMFRYDRPQAGRYRQFFQIGGELFGIRHPYLDMEIMQIAVKIFDSIGLNDYKLHINTVGCPECRKKYIDELKKFLINKEKDLCSTCKARLEKNVLRIFDCKEEKCKSLIIAAPKISDHVCQNCSSDFISLKKYLDDSSIKYIHDKFLVRGLDYYTGNVFEIKTNALGAQDALAAGGRYDNLVHELGGEITPACGFALGVDRTVDVLVGMNKEIPKKKKIYFISTSENNEKQLMSHKNYINELREKGFVVRYDIISRSVKAQMRSANNEFVDYVVFMTDNNKKLDIKNMVTGEQKEINGEEIDNYFMNLKDMNKS
jgi:histidyl-tRNA synthetase